MDHPHRRPQGGLRRLARLFAGAGPGREDDVCNRSARHGLSRGKHELSRYRPQDGVVEVGSTWLNPSQWGTGANVEAKLLMLDHAFTELAARYWFLTLSIASNAASSSK